MKLVVPETYLMKRSMGECIRLANILLGTMFSLLKLAKRLAGRLFILKKKDTV